MSNVIRVMVIPEAHCWSNEARSATTAKVRAHWRAHLVRHETEVLPLLRAADRD